MVLRAMPYKTRTHMGKVHQNEYIGPPLLISYKTSAAAQLSVEVLKPSAMAIVASVLVLAPVVNGAIQWSLKTYFR